MPAPPSPLSPVTEPAATFPFTLRSDAAQLAGELALPAAPAQALALVVQPTSQQDGGPYAIAQALLGAGLAVCRIDLLTPLDTRYPDLVRDVPLLENRLATCLSYLQGKDCRLLGLPPDLPLVIVASGGGAPAALRLTATRQGPCRALVCRNGFIDLAGRHALGFLPVPLLYLAEERPPQAPQDTRETAAAVNALSLVQAPHELVRCPGRKESARAATDWVRRWLPPAGAST